MDSWSKGIACPPEGADAVARVLDEDELIEGVPVVRGPASRTAHDAGPPVPMRLTRLSPALVWGDGVRRNTACQDILDALADDVGAEGRLAGTQYQRRGELDNI